MDFSALIADLRTIAGRYNGRDTDRNVSTAMYCEMFRKILQKAENGVTEYADQIVILWMTLSQLCNTYQTLTSCPARDSLYQHIFLLCAKVVLNIKWQQLPEDDQGKVNFSQTIANTHQHLVKTGFNRFELLTQLMENPWTDPTLSMIMSGDDKEESSGSDTETEETEREKERKLKEKMDKINDYINKEDSLILKLRVEMLILENCEDFAVNLCNCLVKYNQFKDDLDLREMQFRLLHKLNQMDRLQEECEQIVCHTGIKIINRLEQKESNQQLCIRLVQIFLVQDWINPDRNCCTKELLKLWIRHQYMADRDRAKFLENVWSIAKLSYKTDQICLLVSGLQKECGAKLRQLYTDLCVYAINIDKGGCEKEMMQANMEGLKERQKSMAVTCEKLAGIVAMTNLKAAKISALTAFALNPTKSSLYLVEKMYLNKTINQASNRKKEKLGRAKDKRETHDGDVNLATLYEVERLLNMLRPYYLNPDLQWEELLPVCKKFMVEKGATEIKDFNKEPKEKMSTSVKDGLMQYYCDDTIQFMPAKQTAKSPSSSNSPPKSPWTSVTNMQNKLAKQKDSTKLIPYAKLQNVPAEGPIDMSKSATQKPPNTQKTRQPEGQAKRGRGRGRGWPAKYPNFDFAKLLEATKNLPQMQNKPSISQGNVHLPYVPGLTTQEVEQAMILQKKNYSRSVSHDQLSSKKQVTSYAYQSPSQSHRTRVLSLDRQQSGIFQPATAAATDLSKTSHRPRILPDRSNQDKSSTLMSFQDSFAVNQRSQDNVVQSNQVEVTHALTLNTGQGQTTAIAAPRSRKPSKEELQSIVDWLQTGTEDARVKPQIVVQQTNEQSIGLVQKKQETPVQYVTLGSNSSQAIQNTQQPQGLKIQAGVSKNFASQVMSKIGLKPGMTEEEINIAKIKAIMAQKQLEIEQQRLEKQQKKAMPSKGFLLIPGSAQMVMQSKMQGQKNKNKTVKSRQKKDEKDVAKTLSPLSNYKASMQNVGSHEGHAFVNQMIQASKPQTITKQSDLSTQPTYNLGAQPIATNILTTATTADGNTKTARFRDIDIQHALQSLSKVLDKSNNVLNQNNLLQEMSKKSTSDLSPQSVHPTSAVSSSSIVATNPTNASALSTALANQTLKSPQTNSSAQNSAYQLLYLGQIKTGSLKETGQLSTQVQTASSTVPTYSTVSLSSGSGQAAKTFAQNVNQMPIGVQTVTSQNVNPIPAGVKILTSHNVNQLPVGMQTVTAQNVNQMPAGVQILTSQNLNQIQLVPQTVSSQNVNQIPLGLQTVTSQNVKQAPLGPQVVSSQNLNPLPVGLQTVVSQNVSQIPLGPQTLTSPNVNQMPLGLQTAISQNVEGLGAQTVEIQNYSTQNMVVQGIGALPSVQQQNTSVLGSSSVNTSSLMVQGITAQTIANPQNLLLQGIGAQQVVSVENQMTVAQPNEFQSFNSHNPSVIQNISAEALSLPGVKNLPAQTVTTNQTGVITPNNYGQNMAGFQSNNLPVNSNLIGSNININTIVPNTIVTSTALISSQVPTLTSSNMDFTSVNSVFMSTASMMPTQSQISTTERIVSTNVGNISDIISSNSSSNIGNVLISNEMLRVSSVASTNYASDASIQQGQFVLPNTANTFLSSTKPLTIIPSSVAQIASNMIVSPSLVSSNGTMQPFSMLPDPTKNVLVGPFQLVTNTSVINSTSAPQNSSSGAYLIPVTSAQCISSNIAPVMNLSTARPIIASHSLSQSSEAVGKRTVTTSIAENSPMLQSMLLGKHQFNTVTNQKSNLDKETGLEVVRRVSTDQLQLSTFSGQNQQDKLHLSAHVSESTQNAPKVQDSSDGNILTSTTMTDNMELLGNINTTASTEGLETMLSDTLPTIPNSAGLNIVDIHITTCGQNDTEERAQIVTEIVDDQKGNLNQEHEELSSETAPDSLQPNKIMPDTVQENFWKDFSRFKERMAGCKLPSSSQTQTESQMVSESVESDSLTKDESYGNDNSEQESENVKVTPVSDTGWNKDGQKNDQYVTFGSYIEKAVLDTMQTLESNSEVHHPISDQSAIDSNMSDEIVSEKQNVVNLLQDKLETESDEQHFQNVGNLEHNLFESQKAETFEIEKSANVVEHQSNIEIKFGNTQNEIQDGSTLSIENTNDYLDKLLENSSEGLEDKGTLNSTGAAQIYYNLKNDVKALTEPQSCDEMSTENLKALTVQPQSVDEMSTENVKALTEQLQSCEEMSTENLKALTEQPQIVDEMSTENVKALTEQPQRSTENVFKDSHEKLLEQYNHNEDSDDTDILSCDEEEPEELLNIPVKLVAKSRKIVEYSETSESEIETDNNSQTAECDGKSDATAENSDMNQAIAVTNLQNVESDMANASVVDHVYDVKLEDVIQNTEDEITSNYGEESQIPSNYGEESQMLMNVASSGSQNEMAKNEDMAVRETTLPEIKNDVPDITLQLHEIGKEDESKPVTSSFQDQNQDNLTETCLDNEEKPDGDFNEQLQSDNSPSVVQEDIPGECLTEHTSNTGLNLVSEQSQVANLNTKQSQVQNINLVSEQSQVENLNTEQSKVQNLNLESELSQVQNINLEDSKQLDINDLKTSSEQSPVKSDQDSEIVRSKIDENMDSKESEIKSDLILCSEQSQLQSNLNLVTKKSLLKSDLNEEPSVPAMNDQEQLVSDQTRNKMDEISSNNSNETVSQTTVNIQLENKDSETLQSVNNHHLEKEEANVLDSLPQQTEALFGNDLQSKSDSLLDEKVQIQGEGQEISTPKSSDEIIDGSTTPPKNDLMTKYKMLMDEMLNLSASKNSNENDQFSASKNFGFDDLEKLGEERQNGTNESANASLPENCIPGRHLTRSLPDDWTPGQTSRNLGRSISDDERTLKRSYSDIDLSSNDGNMSDFDTRSVKSKVGRQKDSRYNLLYHPEDGKYIPPEYQNLHLKYNGGKYALSLPQLGVNSKKVKKEISLLTYGEWKNKDDDKSENKTTPPGTPMYKSLKSEEINIEEKIAEKEAVNSCLICRKTFKTMEELRQHVINPCRPTDMRKIVQEPKELGYETVYTCTQCKNMAKSEYAAKRHSDVCPTLRSSDYKYNIDTTFRCKMCGETFKYHRSAREHVAFNCKMKVKISPKKFAMDNSETGQNVTSPTKSTVQSPVKTPPKSPLGKLNDSLVSDYRTQEKCHMDESLKSEGPSNPPVEISEIQEYIEDDCDLTSTMETVSEDRSGKKTTKKDKIEAPSLPEIKQENKSKNSKTDTEKDVDNESVKSFSTESSYMTIDASETSSIKSGEYKARPVPPKQSVRLISKQVGKRVIKVKKFFGDQFEVPKFVETQVKKVNLKRKFKPGNRPGLNISPKFRRALKKKEISKAKKNLKLEKQVQGNNQVKRSTEKDNNKGHEPAHLQEIKEGIEKIKSCPSNLFTKEDSKAILKRLCCMKKEKPMLRCPIRICRSALKTKASMVLHAKNSHHASFFKSKGKHFECKHCDKQCDSIDNIVKHSMDHYVNFVLQNIEGCTGKTVMLLLQLMEKRIKLSNKKLNGGKLDSKSQSSDDKIGKSVQENKNKSDLLKKGKDENSEKQELKKGNKKISEELSMQKLNNSSGRIKRSEEIGKGKTENQKVKNKKSEEHSESETKHDQGEIKLETRKGKSTKSNDAGSDSRKVLSSDNKLAMHNTKKINEIALKQSVKESDTEKSVQRRSSRNQSSATTKTNKDDVIKSSDKKLTSETNELDKTTDCFSSPDSSYVRRSSRRKTDGFSVYKDFEMPNKKLKLDGDQVECEQSGSEYKVDELEQSVKPLTTRSAYKNEPEAQNTTKKSCNKEVKSDHVETPTLRNARKRNRSPESDSSKISDTKEVKSEEIETITSRKTRKRHVSLDSNSSKTSVMSDNVGQNRKDDRTRSDNVGQNRKDDRTRSDNVGQNRKDDKTSLDSVDQSKNNTKKVKRKSADIEIMSNLASSVLMTRHRTNDLGRRDKLTKKKSQCIRNVKKRKPLSKQLLTKKTIKKDTTKGNAKNSITEDGQESAFLESFKQFVGISGKAVTSQVKSLKQGKSNKLKAQAILHHRRQTKRKSKLEEKSKVSDEKTFNKMVEVVDLVEIKDFRNKNKDVEKESTTNVEVIDLTDDSDVISDQDIKFTDKSSKEENQKVKHEKNVEESHSNTTDMSKNSCKKPSFLDSFLAHVNESATTDKQKSKNRKSESRKCKNITEKDVKDCDEDSKSKEKPDVCKEEKKQEEKQSKDQLKCSTKKVESENRKSKNRKCQKKTAVVDKEDKTDTERQKQPNGQQPNTQKRRKSRLSSKDEDNKQSNVDQRNCKSPDSFQNSFKTYIDSNDLAEEASKSVNSTLKVGDDKKSRKKSPFKWDLDDEEVDGKLTVKSSESTDSKTKQVKCSKSHEYTETKTSNKAGNTLPNTENKGSQSIDSKSSDRISNIFSENLINKSEESDLSKVSDTLSNKNKEHQEKFANVDEEVKAMIITRKNSGHDVLRKDAVKNTEINQITKKTQKTDFEKHFVKFLSTALNKDGKDKNQTESDSVIIINDDDQSDENSAINHSATDSKTGEDKTKETNSLDSSALKSKHSKSVSSTLDKTKEANSSDSSTLKSKHSVSVSSTLDKTKDTNPSDSLALKTKQSKSVSSTLDKIKETNPSDSLALKSKLSKSVSSTLDKIKETNSSDSSELKSKHSKSVSSTLDCSPLKSNHLEPISSTPHDSVSSSKDVVLSSKSFKSMAAEKAIRKLTARYNLPAYQSKKASNSTKSFIVKKNAANTKLIPLSTLKPSTPEEMPKTVLDLHGTQTENDHSKPQATEGIVKEGPESFEGKVKMSTSQHKLVPLAAHRVRHMYHGGKVWQIGQGSVSAMNLASPGKSQTSSSKLVRAGNNLMRSDGQGTHVNQTDTGSVKGDTHKEGEKQSRWKARKSPVKRPGTTDINIQQVKRTRNAE